MTLSGNQLSEPAEVKKRGRARDLLESDDYVTKIPPPKINKRGNCPLMDSKLVNKKDRGFMTSATATIDDDIVLVSRWRDNSVVAVASTVCIWNRTKRSHQKVGQSRIKESKCGSSSHLDFRKEIAIAYLSRHCNPPKTSGRKSQAVPVCSLGSLMVKIILCSLYHMVRKETVLQTNVLQLVVQSVGNVTWGFV
ncbi:unnamed protein product [Lepeophtheirus salmonis]|uniref:(salmon louse) hypothetical protein n=1 Tax=Lepeophtheirus salmonis TaxID=72036 RepID=A0A7R8CSE9_LEPSM|nr:unnamed protein product [Lepeophtheirus salmonis]CAF2915397.1 unnamed protein product [Lepeophtheirus salmonis]